jgi:hypothetical protein
MTTALLPQPALEAFTALAALVRQWRQEGKRTTTAGIKPALARAMDGSFNERELGFASFRDFAVAAELAGFIQLYRPERGHWLMLLPDEDPAAVEAEASTPASAPPERLKPPVWSVFVEWGDDWVRLWDRRDGRAFWYPTDASGRPAWEADPGRFVPIEHASESIQIEWMREWAETLAPQLRDALLPTIGIDAVKGSFRARLSELGLTTSWREELRRRVLDQATSWATVNHVSRSAILDQRRAGAGQSRSSRPSLPDPLGASLAPPPAPSVPPPSPRTASGAVRSDFESEVRAQVHAAVDRMTVSELLDMKLPVHATVAAK